jgi:hypothetical protein
VGEALEIRQEFGVGGDGRRGGIGEAEEASGVGEVVGLVFQAGVVDGLEESVPLGGELVAAFGELLELEEGELGGVRREEVVEQHL